MQDWVKLRFRKNDINIIEAGAAAYARWFDNQVDVALVIVCVDVCILHITLFSILHLKRLSFNRPTCVLVAVH